MIIDFEVIIVQFFWNILTLLAHCGMVSYKLDRYTQSLDWCHITTITENPRMIGANQCFCWLLRRGALPNQRLQFLFHLILLWLLSNHICKQRCCSWEYSRTIKIYKYWEYLARTQFSRRVLGLRLHGHIYKKCGRRQMCVVFHFVPFMVNYRYDKWRKKPRGNHWCDGRSRCPIKMPIFAGIGKEIINPILDSNKSWRTW